MAFETRVGDRTALELVGAGDLLQTPGHRTDDLLERGDGWRVLSPARFALLDEEFADRVRPWPQIVQALLRRAGRRTADVDALRAITCQPRLEVRLVLLLWHLAARWGRVEPAGIRVTLPLTHRLLGQLVGAERPSISHALGRLGHAGLVTGNRRGPAPARHPGATSRGAARADDLAAGARAKRSLGTDRVAHGQGDRPAGSAVTPRSDAGVTPGEVQGQPVNVLWMTSGLGCDGDSIAMTAATNPSLEDLLRGCFPGMPPVIIYNPVLRL